MSLLMPVNGVMGLSTLQIGSDTPDSMSADRARSEKHIHDVRTYLAGAEAVISQTVRYLPMLPQEHDASYKARLDCAKFTNVFRDLIENLSSKPFARTVDLTDDSKMRFPELVPFVENVDGANNHLHVFAGSVFFNAIAFDVDWIVVDKSAGLPGPSLADERRARAKVYWYRVPQSAVRAVYSDVVDGEEVITHFRYREDFFERSGFQERYVERVRLFDRQRLGDGSYGAAYWQVLERSIDQTGLRSEWRIVDQGTFGLGIIPVVPMVTGKRQGRSWYFDHTMGDLTHLQKKLYQSETNLEYAKMMAASPMLMGKDANPPIVRQKYTREGVEFEEEVPATIVVGPSTVLYGEWKYVSVDSNALAFLAKDADRLERQMREIGRQPLTTDSGNLTVVTTMFAAQKGNSAVQAWALGLKDALEQAFKYTAMWMNMGDSEPEVNVWTDFSIDLESEAAPEYLRDAQTRNLISRKAYLAEGKRRNFLSAEYNAEEDIETVVEERREYEFLAAPEKQSGGEVGSGRGLNASGGNSATSRVRADLNGA